MRVQNQAHRTNRDGLLSHFNSALGRFSSTLSWIHEVGSYVSFHLQIYSCRFHGVAVTLFSMFIFVRFNNPPLDICCVCQCVGHCMLPHFPQVFTHCERDSSYTPSISIFWALQVGHYHFPMGAPGRALSFSFGCSRSGITNL